MSGEAIAIRGLVKTFPNFKLGPLDLTVPAGAIYGLIGPNGAGKTTTIDLVMGMGAKDSGDIRVFGLDHLREEVAVKRQIGYFSPDVMYNAWGKVSRLVGFIRSFYPDWDDAYCTDLMRRLKIGWGDKIATLSFGARTKLGLLLALSHRPALLLLDEPFSGLDAVSKQEILTELLDAVQDENRTVLISSHDLHDLERFTDHIGMIHNGKLLLDGPTDRLVERFRMVDCAAGDGGLDGVPGVYPQRREGTRLRLLVDLSVTPLESLETRGAAELVAAPVTLEELFVGLVKERRN
ncbi:MAG: ABC transporter ATP-binding protein [Clostridiales bacterium]|nr:ABC transporter ATP-binding protein [Candidatus Hydrogenedentota bacterium]NLF35165.1 ABC transporter ATP-binding protein [Clostridiales bacterium]